MSDPPGPSGADAPTGPDATGSGGPSAEGPSGERPDLGRLTDHVEGPLGVLAVVGVGLFVLAFFFTLHVGRAFFLPVVLAVLLDYLLSPLVRRLGDFGLPPASAAGVVLLGFLAFTGGGFYYLAGPAADWMEKVPETMRRAEYQLRDLKAPVERVQEAAEQVEEAADVGGDDGESRGEEVTADEQTSLSSRLLGGAWRLVAAGSIALLFLYFLLATGDMFLRKLTAVLPRRRDKRRVVEMTRSLEEDLSTYLATWVLINLGLGLAVAGALSLLEMPTPLLWGVVAAVLNFVPYLGPAVGIGIVAVVSLASNDGTWAVVAPPLAYFVVNLVEGSVVTPVVMGRQLQLNPAVVFLGVFFWGWLWGIPGALLAVPMLATFKIFCDHVAVLSPVGVFLSR
jgi:predicted PurR-regulated permease PerM